MSAAMGVVSLLADANSGAVPGDAWMADIAALSPAPHHLLIRAPISVDATNRVNIPALTRALAAYRAAGFAVWLVLHGGLETHYQSLGGAAYAAAMPNAALGLGGDLLQNDYINRFSLTAVGTLLALGDLCPDTVFVWNEPNLDGPTLRPGQRPIKASSLAPEVFGALLSTTAKRIRASVPAVRTILPGSLSCLVKFDTDPGGPYVAGYLHAALAYMNRYGTVAPYPFGGIALNLEGVITDAYAAWCASTVTRTMRAFSLEGQAVVGECGLANGAIAAGGLDLGPTYAALAAHFAAVFAFQHPTEVPDGTTGYGMTTWSIDPTGTIVPTGHTPAYATYQAFLRGLQPPPSPPPSPPLSPR